VFSELHFYIKKSVEADLLTNPAKKRYMILDQVWV